MLSILSNVLYVLKIIVIYTIFISYNTGKFIVSSFLVCFDVLFQVLDTLWTLLTIINEDLLVFIYDVLNKISFLVHTLVGGIEYGADTISNTVWYIFSFVINTSNFIVEIYHGVIHLILQVISCIANLCGTIKHLIVMFGSGMWLAVTLFPLSLFYIAVHIVYAIGKLFDEIVTGIQTLTTGFITNSRALINFIIDVPLESIAGLLSCACLTYAIFKFNVLLYGRIRNISALLLRKFKNLYVQMWRTLLRNITSNHRINRQGVLESQNGISSVPSPHNKEIAEDNRLCVICLERNKCMLAMPCRHLCTCSECQYNLQRYSRSCPICRRHVSYTIHVY